MEQVGIKLELDKLGRICVPQKIRDLYNIRKDVEVLLTDEGICLRNPRYTLIERKD